ncbi:hypothetical protein EZS27_043870, partial [termite gut metagenome]
LFTRTLLMLVISPTSLEVRPWDFNKITWQRLRKQWLLPVLNPNSKDRCCVGLNNGVLTRPVWDKEKTLYDINLL